MKQTSADMPTSRDKRNDCVQAVIALVDTPEGFPLAYEVMPGNTAITRRYAHSAKDRRPIWQGAAHLDHGSRYSDRRSLGRDAASQASRLVSCWHPEGAACQAGAGAARIALASGSARRRYKPAAVRAAGLCPCPEPHAYSQGTRHAAAPFETALGAAQAAFGRLNREALLMKLGAARANAPAAWRLIDIKLAPTGARFSFQLNRQKLREVRRREGRYLLRTNLRGKDPAHLWQFYIQLVEVEVTFKRTSRTISAFGRSTTSWGNASRRTYSLHSWPIAST
jgi:hypothetical protein